MANINSKFGYHLAKGESFLTVDGSTYVLNDTDNNVTEIKYVSNRRGEKVNFRAVHVGRKDELMYNSTGKFKDGSTSKDGMFITAVTGLWVIVKYIGLVVGFGAVLYYNFPTDALVGGY